MFPKPKVPKVEQPKTPIPAEETKVDERQRARPSGREALISAGHLKTKAKTYKASLLGG